MSAYLIVDARGRQASTDCNILIVEGVDDEKEEE